VLTPAIRAGLPTAPDQLGCPMNDDADAWAHVLAVTRPALLLADPGMLDEVSARLTEAGVQAGVQSRDPAATYDWFMTLLPEQGVSNLAALTFDAAHGGVTYAEVLAGLESRPSCPRLRCYWSFSGCRNRKSADTCAEPGHRRQCPLPRHDLRKGSLNVLAYSLALFIRDVCGGDLVGWIDGRLSQAVVGYSRDMRRMQAALLEPLIQIATTGPKVWSMVLAELLLVGDPARTRWVETGASMIAIDSLVHAFLVRTGCLRRLGADHPYGEGCYGEGGCSDVLRGLADRVNAREFDSTYPARFPRWVQHCIWVFAAQGGRNICNGNQIDDRSACQQVFCPAGLRCDRVSAAGP
jgi:hypothetical protein